MAGTQHTLGKVHTWRVHVVLPSQVALRMALDLSFLTAASALRRSHNYSGSAPSLVRRPSLDGPPDCPIALPLSSLFNQAQCSPSSSLVNGDTHVRLDPPLGRHNAAHRQA